MTSIQEQVLAIEDRVRALGLTMAFVLKRTGFSQSMWTQWKAKVRSPTKVRWDRIEAEVADLEVRLAKNGDAP